MGGEEEHGLLGLNLEPELFSSRKAIIYYRLGFSNH